MLACRQKEQSLDMQIAALEKFGVDPSDIYS